MATFYPVLKLEKIFTEKTKSLLFYFFQFFSSFPEIRSLKGHGCSGTECTRGYWFSVGWMDVCSWFAFAKLAQVLEIAVEMSGRTAENTRVSLKLCLQGMSECITPCSTGEAHEGDTGGQASGTTEQPSHSLGKHMHILEGTLSSGSGSLSIFFFF